MSNTIVKASNRELIIAEPSSSMAIHCDLFIRLAARHQLPVVYANRYFIAEGGDLLGDISDQYRRGAAVIAKSFANLHREGGNYWYWLEDGFAPLGDAYDGWVTGKRCSLAEPATTESRC
jgi:hypothetical protein